MWQVDNIRRSRESKGRYKKARPLSGALRVSGLDGVEFAAPHPA
jgi:hypothetical protein